MNLPSPTPAAVSASEMLRILAEGTAATTGDDFFRMLARYAAQALGVRYAFAAETLNPDESRSLAYWEGSGYGEGFSYRFPGTPCQRVAQGHVCSTERDLQAKFPEDAWLGQIGAASYVGVPMKNAAGRVLGHIAVLHTGPMQPSAEQIAVLQVFAARGCAELERLQAERALIAAHEQVQRLKERLQAENVYLQEEIRNEHNFEEIVGNGAALTQLLRRIDAAAASDATVLIIGETGTGKELVARALHGLSARRERPLVKVNCGAISQGLVESELFGHVRGAFTGALNHRVGRFELADGGTLFLDEVGELPAEAQVKLLRVLQEQEFEPVGSSQTRRVDVRVIAATNRNLEQAIRDGRFRADLYYRLNVVPLHVPALRERREDIPLLAAYFLQRAARKLGRRVHGFASETLERLRAYDWPGNVRELQNLIERGVVLSDGPVLAIDPQPAANAQPMVASRLPAAPLPSLEAIERQHILTVLEHCGWTIEGPRGAACVLGMNPSTVRSRMKKLGIQRSS